MNKLKFISKVKKSKSEKGITLIALTVTIVVLLILAGVTTKIVLDKGGIVGKAQNAQNTVDEANKKDNTFLSDLENEMDTYMNSTDMSNSEQGGNTSGGGDTPTPPPQPPTPPTTYTITYNANGGTEAPTSQTKLKE